MSTCNNPQCTRPECIQEARIDRDRAVRTDERKRCARDVQRVIDLAGDEQAVRVLEMVRDHFTGECKKQNPNICPLDDE